MLTFFLDPAKSFHEKCQAFCGISKLQETRILRNEKRAILHDKRMTILPC
jgi:hypothetical protein